MIETTEGNLLNAPVEALVNTVNTVGIIGKGIALQFKQAFPQMFRAYEHACKAGEVQLGKVHVFDMGVWWVARAGSSTSPPKGIGVLVAARQIFKPVCKTWWTPSSA